jgi:hypothetical protein
VKALHGEEWKRVFRKCIGDYRLLFVANHEKRIVSVAPCSTSVRQDLPLKGTTQGECHDGSGSETGVLSQAAKSEAGVLQQGVHN